ncbi:MAG: translocation/assembly module TamB domain-containing protein [Rhizobiaceae bacterium]
MVRLVKYIAPVLAFLVLRGTFFVFATMTQAQEEDEKSTLIKFVEEQISSDNFKVSLNGLQGALSSDINLTSITLADKRGVWLTINQPRLVWTRSSLLVGRVNVESLTAKSVVVERLPEPDTSSVPAAEAQPFAVPELPVSVLLEKLSIETVTIDKSVFGLESSISLDGKIALEDGAIDIDLAINRLDGPGGRLELLAAYSNSDEQLKLNVNLSEPENGMIANLLKIEGRPPLSLVMVGDDTLTDFDLKLEFDVAKRRILEGDLLIAGTDTGKSLTMQLAGPLASILPQEHRAFFGAQSRINAAADLQDNGEIIVRSAAIKGGNIDLTAQANLLADGFLGGLKLDLAILPDQATRVLLPTANEDMYLSSLRLSIDYDSKQEEAWSANLVAKDLESKEISSSAINLVASGTLSGVDTPENRQMTFATKGTLSGTRFADQAIESAIGENISLGGSGSWRAGAPVQLNDFVLNLQALNLKTNGQLTRSTYVGVTQLDILDLAAFSGLAGQKLAGMLQLQADGRTEFLSGGFDLTVNGKASRLETENLALNGLLQGENSLSGRAARGENGVEFERLRLGNNQFETTLNGGFATGTSDLQAQAKIYNLSSVTEDASGPLELDLSAKGKDSAHDLEARVSLSSGDLRDRPVENLIASLVGKLDKEQFAGRVDGSGQFNRAPVKLEGQMSYNLASDTALPVFSVSDFVADIGKTQLLANVLSEDGVSITGKIDIASNDIADVAALALMEAKGSINGSVELLDTSGMQTVRGDLKINELAFEDYEAKSLDLVGSVVDVFGKPKVGATLNGRDIQAAGIGVPEILGKIGTSGNVSTFDLMASVDRYNAKIQTAGELEYTSEASTVTIERLQATSSLSDINLKTPTRIVMRGGTTEIGQTTIGLGKGEIDLQGSVGESLALDVILRKLPLDIVNAIAPETRAGGTVSGTIKLAGSSANPTVDYELTGDGLTASQLSGAGVSALSLKSNGVFSNNVLDLKGLTASNSQNINVSANGRIPLSGNGLNVSTKGAVPLSLAEAALQSRGAKVAGKATFDLKVSGAIDNPVPNGLISVENGTFTDPLSNLKLINIGLLAGLDGNQVRINRGGAQLSSGGNITVSGAVGLSANYPADLKINLNQARYTDGQTFTTQLDGVLTVTGQLAGDPTLGGTINMGKIEITIPESFASGGELLNVRHVRPNSATAQTLGRLDRVTPKAKPTSRPSVLRLELTVNAPNQIFVRGRGLDAELGGSVRMSGPVNNVTPIGGFELRRGRLSLLGQRLDLTEGRVTLTGDLDPDLELIAKTSADDVEAFVELSGSASDIQIRFYSSPELPEDEVLALIIFGRSITDLSPTQIVKLASIAAELTGGSSPGLVSSIRQGSGLDDLDIVEDEDGNTAVKAGKYINENIYLGVQAGQNSQEATINLDITEGVTARGAFGTDGNSSLGIFLERDY